MTGLRLAYPGIPKRLREYLRNVSLWHLMVMLQKLEVKQNSIKRRPNKTLKQIAGALLKCGSLFERGRGSSKTLLACTKPKGHEGHHGLAQVKQ